MTEKKLTYEEIVKVLDTCFMAGGNGDCNKCGLFSGNGLGECMRTVAVETLDLIQQQKAEIERLKDENIEERDIHFKNLCGYKDEIARLQKQVDELKSENTELYNEHTTLIAGSLLEKQNTVKDTAKEIFETIFYDCWAVKDEKGHKIFDEGKIKDFAKKCYGVEVE